MKAALDQRARDLQPRAAGAWLRAWAPALACVAIAVVLQLVVKPLVVEHLNSFYAKLLLDIGTNIILAVSLTIVNGFTGQFSIGHAAFMAVGAYTAAAIVYYGSYRIFGNTDVYAGMLSTSAGEREGLIGKGDPFFLLALLAGGLAAAACGYLVGLPPLRLKGDYLAIVTLGFGEIVGVLIQQTTETIAVGDLITDEQLASISVWRDMGLKVGDEVTLEAIHKIPVWLLPKFVGGSLGFVGLPLYSSLFWSWLFAGITLLVAYRLKTSSYGRAFLSIREDEVAAEAMGVHTTRYKVRAFVIAAFFAGIGGGIYAHTLGVQLAPADLGFQKSFDIIIMVVLGGMGSISGASLAALILTGLPELLRDPPPLAPWLTWFALPFIFALGWWLFVVPRRRWRDWAAGVVVLGALVAAIWWKVPGILALLWLIAAPRGRHRDGIATAFGGCAVAGLFTLGAHAVLRYVFQ